MAHKDLLQRFIFDKASIRGEFIHLQDSYQTIINQHVYPSPIRELLGEALCVAGLLSAVIKFSGRLSVQFRGNGKLKLLLAQCDNDFHMRGLVKWEGELSHDELINSLKQGVLVIMLDSGTHSSRYQGVVPWQGESLAESIEGYFRDSEQLPTKLWLSVSDRRAAGFLLQIVPSKDKEPLKDEALHLNWDWAIKQAESLKPEDLLKMDDESLLRKLYPDEEIRIFSPMPVSFQCNCSRRRGEEAILILGQHEAEEELKNNQTLVVTCDFCNKEYIFDKSDVAQIFDKLGKPPTDVLH